MNATDSSDNSSFVKLLFFSNVILTNEELWCMNVLMLTTGTIVLCCLIKLLYFKFIRFTHFIPESLISIALGALFGLLKLTTYVELTHYNANTFFIIFLPPIILEAVLQMHRVSLMRNISLIFVFGFFGTVLNFLLLGTSLWLLSSAQFVWTDEQAFRPHAYFLFSALMSCVDPVLVVSILGEMHVNPSLYFIFVGESVINDGVCLIIFHYVHLIGCGHIPWDGGNHGMTALIGIVVVCVKIITGCLIGSIMGCLVCFLTRYTASYAVIEPMLIMSGCYLTYLIDFSASWPGILSILIYGLIQTSYTFENISPKSRITVKRFTHVTASISESLVLMLLGYTSVVERGHGWSANFIVTSLIMTTIWRFLIVYTLATVANHLRLLKDPITETMKFVIGFCGLRGSISHCLVEVIDSACLQANQLSRSSLFSTVFVLTLFTITVIGTLMRPLLKLFRMKFQSQPISLFHALNEELILKLNFLAEEITGATEGGHFSRRLKQFGQKYVSPLLLRDPTPYPHLMDVFGKITLALHYASLATNDSQVTHYLAKIRPPAAVAKSTRPFGSWTSQGSGPPVSPDGTAMLRQYTDVFQNQILRLLTAGILRSDQDIPHFVSHGLAGTSSIDPNQHSAQETGKLPQWNKFGSQNDSSSETGMPWSSTAHVKDSKLSIVHSESFGSNLTMSSSAGKPDKQRISLFRRWCSTLKRRTTRIHGHHRDITGLLRGRRYTLTDHMPYVNRMHYAIDMKQRMLQFNQAHM